jgi:3-oxoacyl-[acyl-carrier protein] reductase
MNEHELLKSEVALVTGATRGIGQAIAQALAGAGARVVGTATTAEGARSIDAAFAEAGLSGRGVQLDVNDGTAVDALL